ncbi:hypothetical protein [Bradyrhizobium australafricanum]|uniref:hypothetical protein n=1 Tax=Bradyrhizobium australafricanum TaxID=2821406 RepID=UPI001CE32DCE|nr:hypothetical protein [Bradyrhizobium australafricanum]MCA6102829.1 hypothetical protein [Bradyrhizobium australafricanum]
MLHDSTDRIAECRQLADEADRSTSSVETTRKDYELLAQSWRRLALSYEFSTHLERFIKARASASRPIGTSPVSAPASESPTCCCRGGL